MKGGIFMSLLVLLEDNGIRSTAQLADALGTSVEMVQARLERYEQLGIVKKTTMSASCGGSCSKCKGCGKNGKAVIYWERRR